MKINFSKESKSENSRYWITDACTSSFVDEREIALPGKDGTEGFVSSMYDVAKKYAETYDHNGTDDEFAICNIEDLVDGESIDFAFDGHGNFEWETSRQG